MKEARSNFKVVAVLLLIAAVICWIISKTVKEEQTAGIFKIIGLAFLSATIIQGIIFSLYPDLFKNKKQVK
ncbi:MAG: hypothetical protein M9904_08735 [Chitinophagaceae bacterium]|nr:hypothetical protein [Chitinophagaceae bacterium]